MKINDIFPRASRHKTRTGHKCVRREECIFTPLTIYTWTEFTDNSARQTLMSGQAANLHALPKSCGDSPGFKNKILRKFCAEHLTIYTFL